MAEQLTGGKLPLAAPPVFGFLHGQQVVLYCEIVIDGRVFSVTDALHRSLLDHDPGARRYMLQRMRERLGAFVMEQLQPDVMVVGEDGSTRTPLTEDGR